MPRSATFQDDVRQIGLIATQRAFDASCDGRPTTALDLRRWAEDLPRAQELYRAVRERIEVQGHKTALEEFEIAITVAPFWMPEARNAA